MNITYFFVRQLVLLYSVSLVANLHIYPRKPVNMPKPAKTRLTAGTCHLTPEGE